MIGTRVFLGYGERVRIETCMSPNSRRWVRRRKLAEMPQAYVSHRLLGFRDIPTARMTQAPHRSHELVAGLNLQPS